jgi:hypothetical protein
MLSPEKYPSRPEGKATFHLGPLRMAARLVPAAAIQGRENGATQGAKWARNGREKVTLNDYIINDINKISCSLDNLPAGREKPVSGCHDPTSRPRPQLFH